MEQLMQKGLLLFLGTLIDANQSTTRRIDHTVRGGDQGVHLLADDLRAHQERGRVVRDHQQRGVCWLMRIEFGGDTEWCLRLGPPIRALLTFPVRRTSYLPRSWTCCTGAPSCR